jgi:hypothetical protein
MRRLGFVLVLCLSRAVLSQAGEVELVNTVFTQRGDTWYVSTTLRHDDTGWEQYADAWRVVTTDGKVLGTRVLYHPHENEQPFTRSLGGIKIPADLDVVYVEAHCKVHGWSSQRLQVDLRQKAGERFQVHR